MKSAGKNTASSFVRVLGIGDERFLLKVALDAAIGIFEKLGDTVYVSELKASSAALRHSLVRNAWKGDYFARLLFNRKDKPDLTYLGAGGDGLQIEEGAAGTYFLNSFSWSVLSDCADEEQISIMLDSLDRNLRTPFGFRLCTGVDYPRIAPKIDVALYYAGDRENGAVFKHANMMAAAAMLRAAGRVGNRDLAERLARTAYWVIDCILPYRTLQSPFETCGNPRFCTQYNNSETGENIGPTLSLDVASPLSFHGPRFSLATTGRDLKAGGHGCGTHQTGASYLHGGNQFAPQAFRLDGEEIDGTKCLYKTHEISVLVIRIAHNFITIDIRHINEDIMPRQRIF